MNTEGNEQVLSIKDLIFHVLRKWKLILIMALIAAIALGGVKGLQGAAKPAVSEEQMQEAYWLYEEEKEQLEFNVQRIQSAVAYQSEYLENSELMNMDPYGFYQGIVKLYVDTDYHMVAGAIEQEPDKTSRILQAYQILLKSNRSCEAVAEAVGMDDRYVGELVHVYAGSSNDAVLTIEVRMGDEAQLKRIMDAMDALLQQNHDRVSDLIGEHTVSVISSETKKTASTELKKSQKEQAKILNDLTTELDAAEKACNALARPVFSTGVSVSDIVKFAVVGALAGAVLAVVAAAVLFVVGDKVTSARALEERLPIRVIARIAGERKGSQRGWFDAMEGRVACNSKDILRYAAGSIANCCDGSDKVLVSCPAGVTLPEQVFEKLTSDNVTVAVCGSLCSDPAAMEQIAGCDKVLLVARCDESRYGELKRQIAVARDLGKKIIGCLLVE